MNLICPHCQKQVSVANDLVGQTAVCPQCRGPFTVPMPPTPPPPPMQPSAGPTTESALVGTFDIRPESDGPRVFDASETPVESAPTYFEPHPTVAGDYTRRTSLYLSPRVMYWATPVCLVAIFVLLFFPWTGVYAGGTWLVRQSGVQLAFGGYSEYRQDAFKDIWHGKASFALFGADEKSDGALPSVWAPLVTVYFFLMCIAVVAALAFTLLPVLVPQLGARLKPWRFMVLSGLSALTLLFLVLQVLFSFPLQSRLSERLDKAYEKQTALLEKASADDRTEAAFQRDFQYEIAQSLIRNRPWLRLVLVLNIAGVIASLLEFYLARRAMKPLPRLVFER